MYQNTSTEFNNIIAGAGRTFFARMVCGDEILNRFMSIKLTSQANEDTNTISIGGAVSSFIEVNMEKPDVLITGKEYSLEMGLMVGEAVEWIPMGVFTPQKPKESDGLVTFTAYDRMVSKLSGAYFTDITNYPVDGKVILQEIATKTGIPLGNLDDLPNGIMVPMRMQTGDEGTTTAKPFDGYTYREAVKYLAQMYGKFVTFNRNGELEFQWYTESEFNTNRLYAEPESSESVYTLQKITCTVGGNTLTSGSGTTGISIENPVMTQEILDNVFLNIGGMEYLPTTCSFFGDIRLDLGDIVTVQGRTGIVRKIPVMNLSVDFDGGIITDIGSYGNTEAEESQTKGPTATALDRVYTDLFLVREVLANKVSTDTLEANYATIKQLDAVSARIDKITSTEITTEYLESNYTKTKDLEAKYAVIDLSNVKVESVQDLFVNVGLIKDAAIVDGHITGYLDAVSINAESIKVGTLSIDRLVLNGTEDSLIFALNNIGELTSTHCDTLDGGLITERTITAEHIVTGAITANEIASETITADKINVADLFAQDITATGSITGAKLYGSYIETASGKIGGFDIGSTYLANNTTELGTTDNSVYVGTDGISCGTGLVAYETGECFIKGSLTAKGMISVVGGYYKNGIFYEDGMTASFEAENWRYPTGSTTGSTAGERYGLKFNTPIYASELCTSNISISDNKILAIKEETLLNSTYTTHLAVIEINEENGMVNAPYGFSENGTALSSKYQAKYSYTTTAQHSTGYYKIKINATNAWLLSFVINVYQDYKATSIMVSGYNYGENYWYSPSSVMLGQTTYDTMNVIFGYDSAWNLWVAIPAANYTGISITNVVNGFEAVTMDGLFSISYVTSLSTIQTTISTLSTTATLQGIHPSTTATGNTVAVRHSGGYLFATYFNQSSSAESPTTSSYIMYANSDGFLRKSSLANIKSILGLGSAAYTASTAYAVASHNHDDRYYLKDEITKKFNTLKNELIGGSYTSHIQLGSTGTGTKYVRVFNDNNTVDLRAMTHAGVYHSTASGYGTEGWLIYINTAGAIKTNTTSDKRLKNYISDLSEKEASYLLQEINPILFTYKGVAKEASLDVSCGFYAQEIRDVLVKHDIGYRSYLLIHDNNSDEDIYDLKTDEESVTYGLDYSKLTPVLWKGWQMHQERLEVLEKRVKSLETENVELKQKIETLAT